MSLAGHAEDCDCVGCAPCRCEGCGGTFPIVDLTRGEDDTLWCTDCMVDSAFMFAELPGPEVVDVPPSTDPIPLLDRWAKERLPATDRAAIYQLMDESAARFPKPLPPEALDAAVAGARAELTQQWESWASRAASMPPTAATVRRIRDALDRDREQAIFGKGGLMSRRAGWNPWTPLGTMRRQRADEFAKAAGTVIGLFLASLAIMVAAWVGWP